MILRRFRIRMYKCILDSGEVEVAPLTVLVGRNESGKTALLRALHKLNPFQRDPYEIGVEWPRSRRSEMISCLNVCTALFALDHGETERLETICGKPAGLRDIVVARNYDGQLSFQLSEADFPNEPLEKDLQESLDGLGQPSEPTGDGFKRAVQEVRCIVRESFRRPAEDIKATGMQAVELLRGAADPDPNSSENRNEQQYISQLPARLQAVSRTMAGLPSVRDRATTYLTERLPTFVYMSEYRAFSGTAQLDQAMQRRERKIPTEEDSTLQTILEIAGLDLDKEVAKGGNQEREQRQYDLDDASARLTKLLAERWGQRKYEVQFRADGQSFFTFVKDEYDPSLIKLEERSRGFQWFFSFDLMLMHESKGTFRNCVILLDEPGLHLHPEAQTDLLTRLEDYAQGNVLIYSTHLPFMIDLKHPESIRVLMHDSNGTTVTDDLTRSKPGEKLVLQAALGMSARNSFLVAQRNLIVEGVEDFWVINELSRLLRASKKDGLPDDVLVTPAGGASEVVYLATFMVGQQLDVVVLLDSDIAGRHAQQKLLERWLTRYQGRAAVLDLAACVGEKGRECSIEDVVGDQLYLASVYGVHANQLAAAGKKKLTLKGDDQLPKRVARALEKEGIALAKNSVARSLRSSLAQTACLDDLSEETKARVLKLFEELNKAFKRASAGRARHSNAAQTEAATAKQ